MPEVWEYFRYSQTISGRIIYDAACSELKIDSNQTKFQLTIWKNPNAIFVHMSCLVKDKGMEKAGQGWIVE